MDPVVGRTRADAIEVARNRPDVLGDRPLVVVENHDQALGRADNVVERLERDAAGEGGVATKRDDMFTRAAQVAGGGHAQGGRESGAGVAGAERIVRALGPVEKTARPAGLAELAEKLTAPAGEQFVDIALMGDVEDKLVLGRIEDAMQRQRELDDTQIRADMSAIPGCDGDEFLPDLLGQLRQLAGCQGLDVGGTANRLEQAGWGQGRRLVHLSLRGRLTSREMPSFCFLSCSISLASFRRISHT